MNFAQFANRTQPEPWSGDAVLPWAEPGFSARVLDEHLSQDHDRASRRRALIEAQVEFLIQRALGDASGCRILDLGCGPGLHSRGFAERGHRCVGIDIAPAAIEHARSTDPASEYRLDDVREAGFDSGFDLVLMGYGTFNGFAPIEAEILLGRMRDAAFPGGTVVLEVRTELAAMALGHTAKTWDALPRSVFSDEPHLCCEEHFWYPEELVAVSRWFVLTEDGAVAVFVDSLQAYREHDYIGMLQSAGFRRIGRFPAVADDPGYSFLIAGT